LSRLPLPPKACRDPGDVKVLGVAVAASANFIVTGAKDLLVLKTYRDVPILSPRAFSDMIHTG
jgi:predicted nucleic acid-binding protein